MHRALQCAKTAAQQGEVPIGAVITDKNGLCIASAGNQVRCMGDPTAHAEILAIRAACHYTRSQYLTGCSLYVTLEPCAMCAAAIAGARIARLYYSASDAKSGGIEQGARVFTHAQTHHKPEIYAGLYADITGRLLTDFFRTQRTMQQQRKKVI